jgi:hypothetical protein
LGSIAARADRTRLLATLRSPLSQRAQRRRLASGRPRQLGTWRFALFGSSARAAAIVVVVNAGGEDGLRRRPAPGTFFS